MPKIYNSNGWRTSTTNGRGKVRTYEFTPRGETKKLTMPDGAIEQWSFNGTGHTSAYTSPLGYVINYAYNDAGRQTTVDYPAGTDTTLAYDSAGRRTSMVDGTGTSSWTFDAASQVTQLVAPQGTQDYLYNLAGQRTSMTEVGQGTTTYSYDTYGRSSSISNRFSESSSNTYDTLGRVSKRTLANGTEEVISYDASYRLVSKTLKVTATSAVLSTESYVYNAADQMTSKTVNGVTTTYTYDLAGQLTGESKTGYVCTYTYDGNGNRLTKTVNGTTETYTYDDGDKMLTAGSKSYGYDSAGRTTSVVSSAGTTNLTYDYESRISTISGPGITASYTYNGLDTRVSKVENSVTNAFVRDGVGVTASVLRDSTAAFTPGVSERRSSVSTFLHSGLKNAEVQTSSSAVVTATKDLDAFGKQLGSTGAWSGPFGYAGGFGYQEDASGLKLLGHRYYDNSTGRFLTRDPERDGRNWYVYCRNTPTVCADSQGLRAVMITLGGGFIVPMLAGSFGWAIGIDIDSKHIGVYQEESIGVGAGLSGGIGMGIEYDHAMEFDAPSNHPGKEEWGDVEGGGSIGPVSLSIASPDDFSIGFGIGAGEGIGGGASGLRKHQSILDLTAFFEGVTNAVDSAWGWFKDKMKGLVDHSPINFRILPDL